MVRRKRHPAAKRSCWKKWGPANTTSEHQTTKKLGGQPGCKKAQQNSYRHLQSTRARREQDWKKKRDGGLRQHTGVWPDPNKMEKVKQGKSLSKIQERIPANGPGKKWMGARRWGKNQSCQSHTQKNKWERKKGGREKGGKVVPVGSVGGRKQTPPKRPE